MQHAWPLPPHPAHVPVWHEVKGAVHSTLFPQQGRPSPPHVPPPHAPPEQVPWPPPHAAPLAVQVRVMRSQHPPLPHHDPSQHGWPLPPHAVHVKPPGWHASPEAVQKFSFQPPLGEPRQQICPSPPQPHAPFVQLPRPMAPQD